MSGVMQHIRNPPQPPTPILACSKLFFCVMPIAQITIGAIYLDDCPRQHYIPIYLIVAGVFGLVLGLLSCLPGTQKSEGNPISPICTAWNSLIGFFLICWAIAGNVWVYSIYQPNYNKNTTNVDMYCAKTLYLFAFWSITLVYILLGVVLVGGCCVFFCFYLCGRADPDDHL